MTETKNLNPKSPSLKEMNWNEINECGTYVFVDTGGLARVPNDALMEGRSPTITLNFGTKGPIVRKLSDDPYIPVSKARQLAADHDCPVNF